MKKKYIEGCEPNHLKDYLGHPLSKYVHGARYRAIIGFLLNKGLLLYVGCGYGVFELKFLSRRKELAVVGADVNGKAIRFGKSRNSTYDFVQRDIEILPFKNVVLDCVVATEVVEHIPNPLESLKRG
jgi:2-polyprenyl-3-methyl-5-hydroxy-6-metoxy-1,4-benzoquinol methylase